ncbi:hypothetical protein SALBM311S_03574 [Streptomyces alboniger]
MSSPRSPGVRLCAVRACQPPRAGHARTEKKGHGVAMESGPAIFVGVVFALFGGGLLVWTAARVRHREPVAHGVSPVASATVASVVALLALALGTWCFTQV